MATRRTKRPRPSDARHVDAPRDAAAADAAAASASAANPAADSAADSAACIGVQLPRHLACTDRYTELDAALLRRPADFFARHRDAPAHFAAAATRLLFSPAQQQQLHALFAPGWQSHAASPLHALVGSCRASSAHRTQEHDEYAARDASVGAFVRKAQRGKQLVVSDVPLGRLPAALAGELVRGPALFQHANMLQVVPQSADAPEQYHALCYAIFATGGSYTVPHVDFYGADAYLYLVSGEKLWLLAPPEKEAEFFTLFRRRQRGATIRLSKADKLSMAQHRMRVIHQRAGEAVFVPGGWLHMVKNLTATVSFGNSYLRPWRLPALLSFAQQQGLAHASRLVDVVGVVRAWMDEARQREWGVSAGEVALVLRRWGAWLKAHVVPAAVACDELCAAAARARIATS